jgi:hypothetical protein
MAGEIMAPSVSTAVMDSATQSAPGTSITAQVQQEHVITNLQQQADDVLARERDRSRQMSRLGGGGFTSQGGPEQELRELRKSFSTMQTKDAPRKLAGKQAMSMSNPIEGAAKKINQWFYTAAVKEQQEKGAIRHQVYIASMEAMRKQVEQERQVQLLGSGDRLNEGSPGDAFAPLTMPEPANAQESLDWWNKNIASATDPTRPHVNTWQEYQAVMGMAKAEQSRANVRLHPEAYIPTPYVDQMMDQGVSFNTIANTAAFDWDTGRINVADARGMQIGSFVPGGGEIPGLVNRGGDYLIGMMTQMGHADQIAKAGVMDQAAIDSLKGSLSMLDTVQQRMGQTISPTTGSSFALPENLQRDYDAWRTARGADVAGAETYQRAAADQTARSPAASMDAQSRDTPIPTGSPVTIPTDGMAAATGAAQTLKTLVNQPSIGSAAAGGLLRETDINLGTLPIGAGFGAGAILAPPPVASAGTTDPLTAADNLRHASALNNRTGTSPVTMPDVTVAASTLLETYVDRPSAFYNPQGLKYQQKIWGDSRIDAWRKYSPGDTAAGVEEMLKFYNARDAADNRVNYMAPALRENVLVDIAKSYARSPALATQFDQVYQETANIQSLPLDTQFGQIRAMMPDQEVTALASIVQAATAAGTPLSESQQEQYRTMVRSYDDRGLFDHTAAITADQMLQQLDANQAVSRPAIALPSPSVTASTPLPPGVGLGAGIGIPVTMYLTAMMQSPATPVDIRPIPLSGAGNAAVTEWNEMLAGRRPVPVPEVAIAPSAPPEHTLFTSQASIASLGGDGSLQTATATPLTIKDGEAAWQTVSATLTQYVSHSDTIPQQVQTDLKQVVERDIQWGSDIDKRRAIQYIDDYAKMADRTSRIDTLFATAQAENRDPTETEIRDAYRLVTEVGKYDTAVARQYKTLVHDYEVKKYVDAGIGTLQDYGDSMQQAEIDKRIGGLNAAIGQFDNPDLKTYYQAIPSGIMQAAPLIKETNRLFGIDLSQDVGALTQDGMLTDDWLQQSIAAKEKEIDTRLAGMPAAYRDEMKQNSRNALEYYAIMSAANRLTTDARTSAISDADLTARSQALRDRMTTFDKTSGMTLFTAQETYTNLATGTTGPSGPTYGDQVIQGIADRQGEQFNEQMFRQGVAKIPVVGGVVATGMFGLEGLGKWGETVVQQQDGLVQHMVDATPISGILGAMQAPATLAREAHIGFAHPQHQGITVEMPEFKAFALGLDDTVGMETREWFTGQKTSELAAGVRDTVVGDPSDVHHGPRSFAAGAAGVGTGVLSLPSMGATLGMVSMMESPSTLTKITAGGVGRFAGSTLHYVTSDPFGAIAEMGGGVLAGVAGPRALSAVTPKGFTVGTRTFNPSRRITESRPFQAFEQERLIRQVHPDQRGVVRDAFSVGKMVRTLDDTQPNISAEGVLGGMPETVQKAMITVSREAEGPHMIGGKSVADSLITNRGMEVDEAYRAMGGRVTDDGVATINVYAENPDAFAAAFRQNVVKNVEQENLFRNVEKYHRPAEPTTTIHKPWMDSSSDIPRQVQEARAALGERSTQEVSPVDLQKYREAGAIPTDVIPQELQNVYRRLGTSVDDTVQTIPLDDIFGKETGQRQPWRPGRTGRADEIQGVGNAIDVATPGIRFFTRTERSGDVSHLVSVVDESSPTPTVITINRANVVDGVINPGHGILRLYPVEAAKPRVSIGDRILGPKGLEPTVTGFPARDAPIDVTRQVLNRGAKPGEIPTTVTIDGVKFQNPADFFGRVLPEEIWMSGRMQQENALHTSGRFGVRGALQDRYTDVVNVYRTHQFRRSPVRQDADQVIAFVNTLDDASGSSRVVVPEPVQAAMRRIGERDAGSAHPTIAESMPVNDVRQYADRGQQQRPTLTTVTKRDRTVEQQTHQTLTDRIDSDFYDLLSGAQATARAKEFEMGGFGKSAATHPDVLDLAALDRDVATLGRMQNDLDSLISDHIAGGYYRAKATSAAHEYQRMLAEPDRLWSDFDQDLYAQNVRISERGGSGGPEWAMLQSARDLVDSALTRQTAVRDVRAGLRAKTLADVARARPRSIRDRVFGRRSDVQTIDAIDARVDAIQRDPHLSRQRDALYREETGLTTTVNMLQSPAKQQVWQGGALVDDIVSLAPDTVTTLRAVPTRYVRKHTTAVPEVAETMTQQNLRTYLKGAEDYLTDLHQQRMQVEQSPRNTVGRLVREYERRTGEDRAPIIQAEREYVQAKLTPPVQNEILATQQEYLATVREWLDATKRRQIPGDGPVQDLDGVPGPARVDPIQRRDVPDRAPVSPVPAPEPRPALTAAAGSSSGGSPASGQVLLTDISSHPVSKRTGVAQEYFWEEAVARPVHPTSSIVPRFALMLGTGGAFGLTHPGTQQIDIAVPQMTKPAVMLGVTSDLARSTELLPDIRTSTTLAATGVQSAVVPQRAVATASPGIVRPAPAAARPPTRPVIPTVRSPSPLAPPIRLPRIALPEGGGGKKAKKPVKTGIRKMVQPIATADQMIGKGVFSITFNHLAMDQDTVNQWRIGSAGRRTVTMARTERRTQVADHIGDTLAMVTSPKRSRKIRGLVF